MSCRKTQRKMREKLNGTSLCLMSPVPWGQLCYSHPKHGSYGFFRLPSVLPYFRLIHGCIINRINSSWGIKLPVIKPLIECSDLGNWFYCPLIQTKIFGEAVRFSWVLPSCRESHLSCRVWYGTPLIWLLCWQWGRHVIMFRHPKYHPVVMSVSISSDWIWDKAEGHAKQCNNHWITGLSSSLICSVLL